MANAWKWVDERGSRGRGDYFGVKLNETIMGFYRFLLFYSCGEGGARTGYWQGLSELSMGIKCGACDASEESGYTGR